MVGRCRCDGVGGAFDVHRRLVRPSCWDGHGRHARTLAAPPRPLRRPVRRAHGRDDGLGDPGPVRRRLAARGGLARRRHAQHLRPAARRGRPRDRRPGRPPGPGRHAVRLRPGRSRAARADHRGDAARGHRGAPRRRGGHRRLPAGRRPGHPGLLRPRRRGDLRGPVVRRGAGRLQGLPVRRRARRDGRRRAGARGAAPGDRGDPGGGQEDQVPLHDPELPQPGRRDPLGSRGGPRSSTSAGARTSWSSRTTPTACSASTASRCGRCGPTRPRA